MAVPSGWMQLARRLARNVELDEVTRNLALTVALTLDIRPALVRYWQGNKVVPQVYTHAQALRAAHIPLGADLVEALDESYQSMAHWITVAIPQARHDLGAWLTAAGVPFMFVKGAALDGYPHGHLRYQNDLDIMVSTWDDLVRVVSILRARGFDYDMTDAPWLVRGEVPAGVEKILGHFSLSRRLERRALIFDVHVMPYLVSRDAYLDNPLWARARPSSNGLLPTPEDKLLFLVAHAMAHGFLLLRDYNDAYALLVQHKSSWDWDYTVAVACNNALGALLRQVLWQIEAAYVPALVPAAVWKCLPCDRMTERVFQMTSNWRFRRPHLAAALAHTRFLPEWESTRRGRWTGWHSSLLNILWHLRFFVQEWVDKQSERAQAWYHRVNRIGCFPELKRGEQIVLIPLQAVLDDTPPTFALTGRDWPDALEAAGWTVKVAGEGIGLISQAGLHLVLTDAGAYLVTYDAYFPEEESERIAASVARLSDLVGTTLPG